jgi:dihydropteroate synthase
MLSLAQLSALYERYRSDFDRPVREFSLGSQAFTSSAGASLMGVINLSPDSWYRESVVLTTEAAIQRGLLLRTQGAAVVDLGAESSLAHAERLTPAVMQEKLRPVIAGLAQEGVLVSVETYHPTVTTACLKAGAKILNLTGSSQTEAIFREVAAHEAGVIICFVQGDNVREVGERTLTNDPIPLLYDYFARKIEEAQRCGVTRIWIDPGLGFYYPNLQDSEVRIRHQMEIFLNAFRLRGLGWPICQALPHAFACFEDEVRSAEPFFAVLALLARTGLLRTHEVAKVRGVLRTMSLFSAPAP